MNDVLQDVLFGVEHDAFEDRLGRAMVQAWRVGACDEVVARMIHDRVRPLRAREAFGQLNPFRKPRLKHGELDFGLNVNREWIAYPAQWLTSGVLDVSNTGGGKSNRVSFSALQLAALSVPVWLIDNYKKQFRHLRRRFQRLGVELVILPIEDWKFNLLQANCCDPRTYLSMIVDLLVRVLDLPPRARSILNHACHELYRKFGIWNNSGKRDAWPTLIDAYEFVHRHSELNAAAREAILDRLGSLLLSYRGAYRLGWSPIELSRHSIALETRGASETAKQLQVNSLLFSVFQHQVEQGVVNGPLKLVIFCDDCQRFVDGGQQSAEVLPIAESVGVIRGSGLCFWASAQTTQGLSKRLLSNLATKVLGRVGCHEDLESLGADMGLTAQQRDWARLHLKPGMFIGQVAEGDWREPFLFTVPLLNVSDVVSDKEAHDSVQTLDSLPVLPATEFAHWEPHHVVELTFQTQPLTDTELRYLQAVVASPGQPSSFYARTIGVSGKRAAEIRARLVKDGYVREHELATGQRGRNATVLEPLAPAFTMKT